MGVPTDWGPVDTTSVLWLDVGQDPITGQTDVWQQILLDPKVTPYYDQRMHKTLTRVRVGLLGSNTTRDEIKSQVAQVQHTCVHRVKD